MKVRELPKREDSGCGDHWGALESLPTKIVMGLLDIVPFA